MPMTQDAQRSKLNREIALLKQIIAALGKYGKLTRGLDVSADLDRYREFLQETIAEREAIPTLGNILRNEK